MQQQQKFFEAQNQNLLLEDASQIYLAAIEGRIRDLFIRQGYVQAAKVDPEKRRVEFTNGPDRTTDDFIDDLIELTLQNSGEVHFITAEHFPKNANLFATSRF